MEIKKSAIYQILDFSTGHEKKLELEILVTQQRVELLSGAPLSKTEDKKVVLQLVRQDASLLFSNILEFIE